VVGSLIVGANEGAWQHGVVSTTLCLNLVGGLWDPWGWMGDTYQDSMGTSISMVGSIILTSSLGANEGTW